MVESKGKGRSYRMDVAAKMLRINISTLKGYEKKGLIKIFKDPTSKRKLFLKEDLDWIRTIRRLIHREGLNVASIQSLLSIVPCWEIKNCPNDLKEKCLALVNKTHPCWLIVEKRSLEEANKCRTCKVYLEAQKRLK